MAINRYFLEVMYKGTGFSGFQEQKNTPDTIQEALQSAFATLTRQAVALTGSSRTDAGVHALQNFFHFDYDGSFHPHLRYKMNAILPDGITVTNIFAVPADAHCRFNAIARRYSYHIYRDKNPFLRDRAHYFPYPTNMALLQAAANHISGTHDFTAFSKRNTQVKTFTCTVTASQWMRLDGELIYRVEANRFLRGMVRGLTGTMLQAGRGKMSLDEFKAVLAGKDCRQADFSVPGHGLFLEAVVYPPDLLLTPLDIR